jgi:hypothetical protein
MDQMKIFPGEVAERLSNQQKLAVQLFSSAVESYLPL